MAHSLSLARVADEAEALSPVAFPYLLLPSVWASRNRAHRRERGDLLRGLMFGGIGLLVASAISSVSFWLTW